MSAPSKSAPADRSSAHHSDIPAEWLAEFEAAARRDLPTRFRYAFIKTHKPVMDDVPYRAFDAMAAYRRWCNEALPDWLGYRQLDDDERAHSTRSSNSG